MTVDTPASAPSPAFVMGLDIGTSKCVVAHGPADQVNTGDLAPNEMSNLATPSMCSFNSKRRSIGESATGQLGTNPKFTVARAPKLLGLDKLATWQDTESRWYEPHARYTIKEDDSGNAGLEVEYRGAELTLRPQQLIGMLLSHLASQARTAAAPAHTTLTHVTIATPDCLTEAQAQGLRDAASIASLDSEGCAVRVVPSHAAAASCYNVTRTPTSAEQPNKWVLFVDSGATYTSAVAYHFEEGKAPAVCGACFGDRVGGETLTRRIWAHFVKELEAKHGCAVKEGTKLGFRLMEECEKAKKTLSTVGQARVDLECFGPDEKDITLSLSLDTYLGLCEAERGAVGALVRAAAEAAIAQGAQLALVELTGGNTRTPWLRKAIAGAAAEVAGAEVPLSFMLDSASAVAFGAVYLSQAQTAPPPPPPGEGKAAVPQCAGGVLEGGAGALSAAEVEAGRQLEAEMQANDLEAEAHSEAMNALESYILEMRSACSDGKHSAHLDSDVVGPLLTAAEDWMYDEGEDAPLAAVQAQKADLQEQIRTQFPQYFERVEADRRQVEAELAAGAAARAAEEASEDKDDHDQRKLKKPERMRLLLLNKEEGTELFKDGNFVQAIQRWLKALQHGTKFFDLSPEDKAEVDDVKVSLYMNIAMAHLKVNSPESIKKAAENCTLALEIKPDHVKGLYRRATAREKMKEFEAARADLKAAQALDPADAAIGKLMERVDIQIKRQEAKEKKMYGKMFG